MSIKYLALNLYQTICSLGEHEQCAEQEASLTCMDIALRQNSAISIWLALIGRFVGCQLE